MKRKLVNSTMRETIRKCTLERNMSDSEIAKQLGISVPTVRKIRKELGIEKNQSGKIVNKPDFVNGMDEAKNADYDSDAEKRKALYDAFRGSFRYQQVVTKYEPVDVEIFINRWIDYQLSLPDMTVAEEDMLESMIDLKLRMDENQKSLKVLRDQQRKILADIRKEDPLDMANDTHKAMYEMSKGVEDTIATVNKEYRELLSNLNVIQKSLNMSREQREEQQKVGGDTFLKVVKMLNDRDTRASIGDRNELLKLATVNKIDKMKRPIVYDDGSVDPILMSGKDAKKEDNSKGSETTQ